MIPADLREAVEAGAQLAFALKVLDFDLPGHRARPSEVLAWIDTVEWQLAREAEAAEHAALLEAMRPNIAETEALALLLRARGLPIETKDGYLEYRDGVVWLTIQQRPSYCDRGRWDVKASTERPDIVNIDRHDGFPRYYFHVASVVDEVITWLKVRGLMPGQRCETCNGVRSIECGVLDEPCPNDPCHGHCEVPCPDCTQSTEGATP